MIVTLDGLSRNESTTLLAASRTLSNRLAMELDRSITSPSRSGQLDGHGGFGVFGCASAAGAWPDSTRNTNAQAAVMDRRRMLILLQGHSIWQEGRVMA